MTEINKLIEKACIEYCDQVNSVYNEKDIFKAGASFILHQNRWRKISDLYLIKSFPLDIIIRTTQEDNKYYYTPTYLKNKDDLETIKYIIEIESAKDPKYSDYIEWKPII